MNEVIIDGCNVAECNFFQCEDEEYTCSAEEGSIGAVVACRSCDNCYFKQLQRAKAEITHWSGLANEANERATEYGNECIKLEEEVRYYKELASENEHNLKLAHQDYTDFIQKQKLEISELKTENETLHITISKLKADLSQAETSLYAWKAENEKLKEWLENKEKAYNHLCDANSRKKEQIKNLNYMLFEEKEMTTQEWKLKYRLANKERKFIQYKEIVNKKLNDYKQALEEVEKYCNECNLKADYTACEVLKIINEVLNK